MKVYQAKVKDLKTRYVISGDPQSQKVVLILHGWGSSLDSWKDFIQLPENNFACFIFFEFPGFGLTQEPANAWFLEDFVDFTNAFQDLKKLFDRGVSRRLCTELIHSLIRVLH